LLPLASHHPETLVVLLLLLLPLLLLPLQTAGC
jgi:hypothetical protein